MSLRFNIALRPENSRLSDTLAQIAQHFEKHQNGYLLGPQAFVHATLGQFCAESEAKALTIFNAFENKSPLSLTIENFYIENGADEHQGFWWAAFRVRKTPQLLKLQADLVRHLALYTQAILTPIETYAPHFTLARLESLPDPRPDLTTALPDDLSTSLAAQPSASPPKPACLSEKSQPDPRPTFYGAGSTLVTDTGTPTACDKSAAKG
ncbi:MAG: hypothetical protein AB7E52_04445 [Bdellovibrionales bacterium]